MPQHAHTSPSSETLPTQIGMLNPETLSGSSRKSAFNASNPNHIRRSRRTEGHAGDDDDGVFRLDKAPSAADSAGTICHVFNVNGIVGDD